MATNLVVSLNREDPVSRLLRHLGARKYMGASPNASPLNTPLVMWKCIAFSTEKFMNCQCHNSCVCTTVGCSYIELSFFTSSANRSYQHYYS